MQNLIRSHHPEHPAITKRLQARVNYKNTSKSTIYYSPKTEKFSHLLSGA